MSPFQHKQHLVRLTALFAAGVFVFIGLQMALVPKGFGALGHFRASAPAEVAALPIRHAGRAACADCHGQEAEFLKSGKHANLGCEACHGPLAKHATEDPSAQKPAKVGEARLCLGCHVTNVAKPEGFPQVDSRTHGEGASCVACHGPHAPDKGPA